MIEMSEIKESAWESGQYGQDENFVKRSSSEAESHLDGVMNLQMISIRLQKELIDDLKFIAKAHGIGYQPLMRDVLARFVAGEKKAIMQEVVKRTKHEAKQADSHKAKRVA
jgi:predicted DNA binding CopG/RHH family protein